jgi:hypothetical protein
MPALQALLVAYLPQNNLQLQAVYTGHNLQLQVTYTGHSLQLASYFHSPKSAATGYLYDPQPTAYPYVLQTAICHTGVVTTKYARVSGAACITSSVSRTSQYVLLLNKTD